MRYDYELGGNRESIYGKEGMPCPRAALGCDLDGTETRGGENAAKNIEARAKRCLDLDSVYE